MALKEKQQLKYSVFRKYPEVTLETITETGSHRAKQGSNLIWIWKTAGREMTSYVEAGNIDGNLGAVRGQDHEEHAKLLGGRNNYRGLMTKLYVFSVALFI